MADQSSALAATPEHHGVDTQLGRAVVIVVSIFFVTSTLSVVLRFYAKWLRKLPIVSEDWVIIAAQVGQSE